MTQEDFETKQENKNPNTSIPIIQLMCSNKENQGIVFVFVFVFWKKKERKMFQHTENYRHSGDISGIAITVSGKTAQLLGWEDGSEVKSKQCSCRRPKFGY